MAVALDALNPTPGATTGGTPKGALAPQGRAASPNNPPGSPVTCGGKPSRSAGSPLTTNQ
ncbi:hypothetical protein [Chlorogloeopsis sp. ULAP02]|uniref:hypothetical protein n=1 Tax=Chlorogloeopsis sp. ULAP02 TaxID=3107926 RepID=UPI00398AC174